MIEKLNIWIRNLPDRSVRNGMIYIILFLLLSRVIFDNVRLVVDVVSIVLFAVLVTAILRPDIKQLLTKIKGVGFPGLQIPISEYVTYVDEVEKKYSSTIRKYEKREDESILNELTDKIVIDNKIEAQLKEIATYYNSISSVKEPLPIGGSRLINYLFKVDLIGRDIYQLSAYYLDLKEKEINENRHGILKIGIRIWKMLASIFRKFKDLKILSSASNSEFGGDVKVMQLSGMRFGKVQRESISLFTNINLLDDFENAYPIVKLNENDFKIFEKNSQGKLLEAEILEVIPVNSDIKMRIVLALDSSLSMNKDNKLILAKEASKALVQSLLSLNLKVSIEIGIFPFSTGNRDGFINFGDKRIWSNSIEELNIAIDRIKANGSTPLVDALNLSLSILEPFEGYKQIICLSDGIDNASEMDYQEIYARAEKSNTPIYSVGYGQDEYLEFLVNISKLTRAGGKNIGSFMKISPENLRSVFSYLSGSINHAYHVRWKPQEYKLGEIQKFNVEINYETVSSGVVNISFYDLSYRMV